MENQVSIGLFLDTRREMKKLGAGVFGVKADLRYMGRRWQFATPFAMTADEWDSIGSRKIRSEVLKEKKILLEAYRSAKKALLHFRPKLYLEDITPDFLQRFENSMVDAGKSRTTIGIYLRSLRAIINEAIDSGLMRREDYPFGRRRYIIPAPKQAKIALPAE